MNIEELRDYCLSVKASSESCPFLDKTVIVFKVMDKMFAFISLEPEDGVFKVCLKCDPKRSVELREQYRGVISTQFKSTLLWNAVCLESDVPDSLIRELIDHSVDETVRKFKKDKKEEFYLLP